MAIENVAPDDTSASRVFELFHENSKQRRNDFEFNKRIYLVNNNPEFHELMARAFKCYRGAEFTPLPIVSPDHGASFEHVTAQRRSVRRFDDSPLEVAHVARLLYFGNGITGSLEPTNHGVLQPVRAAPSGGALYPVEIYPVILRTEQLASGVYHYAVDRHGLELVRGGRFGDVLSQATSDPLLFSHAAVVFVLTGVFGRAHFKYGERGYRFTLLEAGHICQNVLLMATALGLGAVAVGGFIDDEVNDLVDIDGVDEAAVYLIAVGCPAPRPKPHGDTKEEIIARLLGTFWSDFADGNDA
jgi:SagB-type dehydrogenase family enzyme